MFFKKHQKWRFSACNWALGKFHTSFPRTSTKINSCLQAGSNTKIGKTAKAIPFWKCLSNMKSSNSSISQKLSQRKILKIFLNWEKISKKLAGNYPLPSGNFRNFPRHRVISYTNAEIFLGGGGGGRKRQKSTTFFQNSKKKLHQAVRLFEKNRVLVFSGRWSTFSPILTHC